MEKIPKHQLLLLISQLVSWVSCSLYDWHIPPNSCVSTHKPQGDPRIKPLIPRLPMQYSMKVEANILQKNWTTEVEEHYDGYRARASLSQTFNGSTTVSIFDYLAGEKYHIFPNGTCQTEVPEFDVYGFTKMGNRNRPALATVNEVFHFGRDFNQTYIGKEVVRGIPVDHWTSCQEWPDVGAKFQLDYYFSDPDYIMAGGVMQVPVRAVLNGSANNWNAAKKQLNGTHQYSHIYDFTSFRAGSVLNEDVFRIPPGVVCSGKANSKLMPTLPLQFEVSMEVIVPDSIVPPRQQFLRYDYIHYLVETWTRMPVPAGYFTSSLGHETTPPDQTSSSDPRKQTLLTIKTVEDYGNNIVYVLNEATMSCSVHKLTEGSRDTSMAHGLNLFQLAIGAKNFIYQGQANFRDILVDVWAVESDGISQEVYFAAEEHSPVDFRQQFSKRSTPPGFTPTLMGMLLKNRTVVDNSKLSSFFKEIFANTNFSTPWSRLSEKVSQGDNRASGDQAAWGLQLERSLNQMITEKLVHFFHFNPTYTGDSQFEISLCYDDEETATVTFLVNTSYSEVEKSSSLFEQALREAISYESKLSLLQISHVFIIPVKNNSYATYYIPKIFLTLLGKPPVQENKQAPIKLAVEMLREAVKNGIEFTISNPTYAKSFIIDKNTFSLHYSNYTSDHESFFGAYDKNKQFKDSEKSASTKIYTPGAVAGIAFGMLICGAALCLTVVYLLYRRRHPGHPFIPYRLTN